MNALGAKILKAELMGNDEAANELKAKLENARKAKEAGIKPKTDTEREKVRTDLYIGVVFSISCLGMSDVLYNLCYRFSYCLKWISMVM